MTAIPEDVAARAKAAAIESALTHAETGEIDAYEADLFKYAYRNGYRKCYTAERPRIELAALEAMVPHTCCFCAGGGLHGEQYDDGTFREYECFAAPLRAHITELRAEIERAK